MYAPPPFLLGAALLFWGWRADLFLIGALGALLLETSQVVKSRWEFTDKEFYRIWDLCTILVVGLGIYLRFSDQTNPAFTFFLWLPIPLFPMVFGQIYSTREKIPLDAFSWFLRRRAEKDPERGLNFLWIYLAVCLVSAGANNKHDPWFYLGEFALAAWACWTIRPRRFHLATWAGVFVLGGLLGFGGQNGLVNLQIWFEGRASEWFTKFARREFDPTESRTSIGRLGRLKQSSRIVMKVHPEAGKVPEHLIQATYDIYKDEFWRITRKDFNPLPVETDPTTWTLAESTNAPWAVRITSRLIKKRSLIALPLNAAQILDLPSEGVETNSFGAARGIKNPALASYLVKHAETTDRIAPVEKAYDLFVPPTEEDTMRQVAADLQVGKNATDEEKVRLIERFFERNFRYTTYQSSSRWGTRSGTPLATFLLSTRAGHCEYFATATVLLLRQLGVPARYATGYAVQETQGKNNYIVRERHGHAWTLAWLGNHWREVDTTPAGWESAEEQDLPPYRGLRELWASFSFSLSEWRWLGTKGLFRRVAPWLLIPLVAYMGWRIFGKRLKQRVEDWRLGQLWPGADSEFYLLERKLERRGYPRNANETALQWLSRLEPHLPALKGAATELISLHYRYRFDPAGIDIAEREQLKQLVRSALQKV